VNGLRQVIHVVLFLEISLTQPQEFIHLLSSWYTSISIDVRGPGGGGGGSSDDCGTPGSGSGGGGYTCRRNSSGYNFMSITNWRCCRIQFLVSKRHTELATGAIGAGGTGGVDANTPGAGGSAGTSVTPIGGTLTANGGGAGGQGGHELAWGQDGTAGAKVTGSISVTPGESLTVIVGTPGAGGTSAENNGPRLS